MEQNKTVSSDDKLIKDLLETIKMLQAENDRLYKIIEEYIENSSRRIFL